MRLKAVGIAPTINATDYKDPPLKVDAYERDNELYNTGQPTGTRREIPGEGGYSPCVGTTDFGLPKVIKTYELKEKRDILQCPQGSAGKDIDCGTP